MRTSTNGPFRAAVLSAAIVFLATGCAGSNPTIDTSSEAETTFDGLYPVKGGTADAAWARPGVDISKYSKIMLQGVGIEYRPGGESGRTYHSRSGGDHYDMTDAQKTGFQKILRETFQKELEKSEHFTIVDKPGPDVLLVRGGLLDVVSYVPPETVGRSRVFLSDVGEATLVLEIRDSVSGAILARAVDRGTAGGGSPSGMTESNRVENTQEVRRMIRSWARLLRERLDTYGGAET
jgi:hypothetical protein